jgi:hypothetical protein
MDKPRSLQVEKTIDMVLEVMRASDLEDFIASAKKNGAAPNRVEAAGALARARDAWLRK